ncbi:MAG: hypothetical protein FJW30_13620 [Acidobacteria bacterium]|nr:hypothetical protein [Acidobacteriota bacterium]
MRLALLLSSSVLAFAQLSGPTPGFVFDAGTRELRPMRGFAGSAHLGEALIKDADAAAVSADGKLAVASRNGVVELIRAFDSEAPVTAALGQVGADVTFAWSGSDLAVISEAAHRGAIWRSLDSKTGDAESIDLGVVAGDVQAIAFDGTNLYLAAEGGLYRANAGGTSRLIELANASALALDGKQLFVADEASDKVYRVVGDSVSEFASIDSPVGLQVARKSLLIASGETRSITAIDLETKEVNASLPLEFLPERMERLGSSPLALLNRASANEPLWVLDTRGELQVYFVPAGREQ